MISKVIFIKRNILILVCLIFILSLISLSSTSFKSALNGINLCFSIVFPSLFPFLVASEILSKTGFIKYLGIILEPLMHPLFGVPGCGSFALAMGTVSGYPVGAKITAGMREKKLLTKSEAERLIAFSNNSGPLFIIGAVSIGIFNKPELGIFLWIFHVMAAVTVGLIFKYYNNVSTEKKFFNFKNIFLKLKKEYRLQNQQKNDAFGNILRESISNSITTMLSIGGFIILFSVIINLLLELKILYYISLIIGFLLAPIGIDSHLISNILSGFFEITTGINMISKLDMCLSIKLASVAFLIGWAGLSVHFQVISIISKTDISPKPYILGKILQGVFQCLYTTLGLKLISIHSNTILSKLLF